MFVTLTRIIRFGWQNFWRNRWLSVATLSIIVLTLIIFQGLMLFSFFTRIAIDTLKDKVDVSVYFIPEAQEVNILSIQKSLEEREKVKRVEYVSREKALAIFKERHKDDPTIVQALQELESNPLSASLNIKADNPTDYANIVSFLDKQHDWQPVIEKVTYRQNQLVIERLGKIVDTTEKFGFATTVFLSLAAILVTFNTISLSIYSNRHELGIMRLVGSPNNFISGPYVITGIIFGIIAAAFSALIIWPVVAIASPYLKFFVDDINLYDYYLTNFWKFFGYQAIFGVVLGVISSKIAIRRYLKI